MIAHVIRAERKLSKANALYSHNNSDTVLSVDKLHMQQMTYCTLSGPIVVDLMYEGL